MSNTKAILVTGANGQLAMEFKALENLYPAWNFVFLSREQLSLDDTSTLQSILQSGRYSYCINCAAYTAVDKAESEKDRAIAINSTAVGQLADLCRECNIRLIHFSTDYVFNGEADQPYKPTDKTDPVNFYGQTKLDGERLALRNNPDTLIIRTSWVYSQHGKNFVKTMLRLMAEKEQLGVVADQSGCPTYAADLAAAVMQIIAADNFTPGIFHYCNEGIITWHTFAIAIAELSNSSCTVNAIATKDYPTPAKRPAYSALETQSFSTQFNLSIPFWKDSLRVCIAALKA